MTTIQIYNYSKITDKINQKSSTFTIPILKVDNFEKFTVGGNAFQTLVTRSTKNLPEARCASWLKHYLYL